MNRAHSIWTYLIVFVLLHLGSHVSLLSYHNSGVSDYYLPTGLAVILLNWVGLRYVLPVMFFNAVCTSYLWGNPIEHWPLWFLFAIPETLFPLLSWLFFNKLYKGKFWLPDVNNLLLFMVFGVFIPAVIESLLLQYLLLVADVQKINTYWSFVSSNLLAEFSSTFFLTLPVFYYLTPMLSKWSFFNSSELKQVKFKELSKPVLIQLGIVFTGLLILVFVFDFVHFWYLYGVFPLYIAIRCGFGPVILTNFYLLFLIYVLPRFFNSFGLNEVNNYLDAIHVFLGANFVFVFAAVTGRVIDDLEEAKQKLLENNQSLKLTVKELEDTNRELDHFVYSVSHDLSAPLKSIQGLVHVSRLSKNHGEHQVYFDRISSSVKKLENFISEVLDYSKNKRQAIVPELIVVKDLSAEILNSLSNIHQEQAVQVEYALMAETLCQDKMRVRMVLNNVISNAIMFQKSTQGHQPIVRIVTSVNQNFFRIEVNDNGEGIADEIKPHIFEMFYRGNLKSSGSGLGLYIARLAVEKMKGRISVVSTFGHGSTVIIDLPDLSGSLH